MLATEDAAAPAAADPKTTDPPLPPVLAQRSEGDAPNSAPSRTLQLSVPSCASAGALAPELVSAELRAHVMAAEQKVSQNLLQFLQCMEKRLADTLRQVAADVGNNMAKQVVECVRVAEQKAAFWFRELNLTKEKALDMLMRLKEATDTQISEAKAQILFERSRAHEAEANLITAQQLIKKLKAELKEKGRLLEEAQRQNLPAYYQGLPHGVVGRSEFVKDTVRASGEEGQCFPLHTRSISADSGVPLSPFAAALTMFATPTADVQAYRVPSAQFPYSDPYQTHRAQAMLSIVGNKEEEKNSFKENRSSPIVSNRAAKSADLNNQQELAPASKVSRKEDDKADHSLVQSEDSSNRNKAGEVSPSLFDDLRHAQLQSADPEVRLMNVSDEERSCLSAEGIHGNSSVAELTPVEEYQSDVNHDGRDFPKSNIPCKETSVGREHELEATQSFGCSVLDRVDIAKQNEEISSSSTITGEAGKCKDTGTCCHPDKQPLPIAKEVTGQDSITTTKIVTTSAQSPSMAKTTFLGLTSASQDLCPETSSIAISGLTETTNTALGEDDCRPHSGSGSPRIQQPRRKRKQATSLSKEKNVEGAKRPKGPEDAIDRLPSVASGPLDDFNRGDRQVMLVARQLVKLAGSRR